MAIRKLRRRFDLFIVCSETFRIGIISEEGVGGKFGARTSCPPEREARTILPSGTVV
jgi:hypothetical protein